MLMLNLCHKQSVLCVFLWVVLGDTEGTVKGLISQRAATALEKHSLPHSHAKEI